MVVLAAALLVAYLTVGHRPARSATTAATAASEAPPQAASAGASTAGSAGTVRASVGPRAPVGTPGAPAPFVQAFAQQSGAERSTARPTPTGTVSIPVNIDGCDHDYGGIGICVPWTFPAGVTDRCGWLRAQGFGPLAVVGTDRLSLDTNHDRVACGQGDAA
jgi:hypothetical protein